MSLPAELLELVFTYGCLGKSKRDAATLLCSCACVCRSWCRASSSNVVWRVVVRSHVGGDQSARLPQGALKSRYLGEREHFRALLLAASGNASSGLALLGSLQLELACELPRYAGRYSCMIYSFPFAYESVFLSGNTLATGDGQVYSLSTAGRVKKHAQVAWDVGEKRQYRYGFSGGSYFEDGGVWGLLELRSVSTVFVVSQKDCGGDASVIHRLHCVSLKPLGDPVNTRIGPVVAAQDGVNAEDYGRPRVLCRTAPLRLLRSKTLVLLGCNGFALYDLQLNLLKQWLPGGDSLSMCPLAEGNAVAVVGVDEEFTRRAYSVDVDSLERTNADVVLNLSYPGIATHLNPDWSFFHGTSSSPLDLGNTDPIWFTQDYIVTEKKVWYRRDLVCEAPEGSYFVSGVDSGRVALQTGRTLSLVDLSVKQTSKKKKMNLWARKKNKDEKKAPKVNWKRELKYFKQTSGLRLRHPCDWIFEYCSLVFKGGISVLLNEVVGLPVTITALPMAAACQLALFECALRTASLLPITWRSALRELYALIEDDAYAVPNALEYLRNETDLFVQPE